MKLQGIRRPTCEPNLSWFIGSLNGMESDLPVWSIVPSQIQIEWFEMRPLSRLVTCTWIQMDLLHRWKSQTETPITAESSASASLGIWMKSISFKPHHHAATASYYSYSESSKLMPNEEGNMSMLLFLIYLIQSIKQLTTDKHTRTKKAKRPNTRQNCRMDSFVQNHMDPLSRTIVASLQHQNLEKKKKKPSAPLPPPFNSWESAKVHKGM